jgi:hypothetical protein
MVDDAFGLVFEEHRGRMDADGETRLGCFVDILACVEGAVREEGAGDAFADVCVLVVLVDAQFLVVDIDFDPFHEPGQLLPDIPRSPHRPQLDEIVSTPLITILELLPGVVDVQKSQVVAARSEKGLLGVVRMHLAVLGTEEDAVAYGEHGTDCYYLVDALVDL